MLSLIKADQINETSTLVTIDNIGYKYNPNLFGDYKLMVNLVLGLEALIHSSGPVTKSISLPFYKGRERLLIGTKDIIGNINLYWYEKLIGSNSYIFIKNCFIYNNNNISQFEKDVDNLRSILL